MDNLDLNRIRSYITCSLCSKLTEDPRILDCYHSFCINCLRDRCQIKDDLEQALANCPQCQATFEIPNGGLEYLRKNTFQAKIYETYMASMLCEICAKDMAERRCEECNQIYCEMCSSFHLKFQATKGHTLSPLNDMAPESSKKSEYSVCQEHAKKVDMFCSVCLEFVCIVCFAGKHNGHQVKLIGDKFEEVKKYLSEIVDRKNETLSKLAAEREVVVPLRYQSTVKADELRRQMRVRGEALKSIVDNHVSVLCNEVDANLDTYHAKVDTLVEALDTLKNKVEAEMKDNKAKIRDLDFRTVIGYAKQEQEQPEPDIPSFREVFGLEFHSTDDQQVLSLANVIGTVSDGKSRTWQIKLFNLNL